MRLLMSCAVGLVCALFLMNGTVTAAGYDWGQTGVADIDRVDGIEQITDNDDKDNLNHDPYSPDFYTDAWRNDSRWVVYMCEYGGSANHPDKYAEICVGRLGDPDATAASARLAANLVEDTNAITNNSLEDTNASFTPDGNEIVFQRWVQGYCTELASPSSRNSYDVNRREIWKMDFVESGEATNQQSLTQAHLGDPCATGLSSRGGCTGAECIQEELLPKVSPDGSMIAFLAYEVTYTYSLWVMDADGTDPRKVSGDVDIYNSDQPQHGWSPDSQWVLFTGEGETENNALIYRTKPDGSAPPEALTQDEEDLNSIWAFWSPDGTKIAYTRREETEDLQKLNPNPPPTTIYRSTVTLMDPDGGNKMDIVQIDDDFFRIGGPKTWDPGSGNVIYNRETTASGGLKTTTDFISLWMVSRNGSENHQLTDNYDDCSPQWSPDGTMVLFVDPGDNSRDEGGLPSSASGAGLRENINLLDDLLLLIFNIDNTFDDGDGVSNTEESGPAGDDLTYDGDDNGAPDYLQNSAASLHADTGVYVTLGLEQVNNAAFNDDVEAIPPPPGAPNGVTFPLGFFSYSIDIDDGACTTVTIYAPRDESITSFWKYDETNGYFEFLYDGTTGAEIFHEGDQTRIVIHLCDGLRGDADNKVNGTIEEPGAPAAGRRMPIPTLGQWGGILLLLLMAGAGIRMVRRRKK